MKQSKTVDHCSRLENLAPEIISNILSKLDIEWILSCKRVCKNWYALIKDDFFVKLQLSIVNNQPSTRIIFQPSKFKDRVTELYLLDVEDCKAREIPACTLVDTHNCNGLMSVMSSLDGLVCLINFCNPNPVVIYNPLIRGDYVILPEIGATNVNQDWESLHITLGFDPSIKKYKVVRMMTLSFDETVNYPGFCEVITLGGEETTWRQVAPPHAGLRPKFSHRGVFHQGSIYWIIDNGYDEELIDNHNDNREYILEFDVTNEVFRTISFPHLVKAPSYRTSNCKMNLQILEGECLALLQIDSGFLHTWRVVKQNADRVVDYSSIRIEPAYKGARVLEFFCPNGREDCLLLRTRKGRRKGQFVYYYPFASSTNKLDHFVKLEIFQDLLSGFLPFQPSLVSAKSAFQGLVN